MVVVLPNTPPSGVVALSPTEMCVHPWKVSYLVRGEVQLMCWKFGGSRHRHIACLTALGSAALTSVVVLSACRFYFLDLGISHWEAGIIN